MKRTFLIVVAIAVTCVGVVLPTIAYADSPSPATAQNQVTIDVTLNDAGYLTAASVDLKQLGVGQLDSQTITIAKNLQSVHLSVQGETVTADVAGQQLLKMAWAPASRQTVAELAAKYGYAVSPDVLGRVEEWISTSNLDVTARFTNEPSKAPVIKLSKPLWVDIGANGEVAVEKGPLSYGIDKSVMDTIKLGGLKNAAACWANGTLNAKVDGKNLPSITIDPKGALMITKALNLAVSNLDPFFAAQVGVDVSLPGGAHQVGATCGQ